MSLDPNLVARVVGIEAKYLPLASGSAFSIPQQVGVFGQGNTATTYALTKRQVTTLKEVGDTYGYGSPLYQAAKQLLPTNGDGVGTIPVIIFPLDDAAASVVAAGDITPTVAATEASQYVVVIGGVRSNAFPIAVGDVLADVTAAMTAAINAVLDMPVIATDGATKVDLAAKHKGVSGNDITISVEGDFTIGNTFVVTDMVGGLVDPSTAEINAALDQMGEQWITMAVNCLGPDSSDALDAFNTFALGRWGALTHKPIAAIAVGNPEPVLATSIAIPDARPSEYSNVFVPAPGSPDMPVTIAARAIARAIELANRIPAHDYGGQKLTGVTPGDDGVQWPYPDRNLAVNSGSSTTVVKDGVVEISDLVTSYHPEGDPVDEWRFVVDLVRLQNVIYNQALYLASLDGRPIINDVDVSDEATAIKPSAVKAGLAGISTALGLAAILADTAETNKLISVLINGTGKGFIMKTPIKLSGNANILDLTIEYSFNIGTAA